MLCQTVCYMMSKYLKTENASVTLEYNKSLFGNFLQNNLSSMEEIGIQRIYIVCDVKDILNVYDELIKYEFNQIIVFIKIDNYNDGYFDELKKMNYLFYTIISCNVKSFNKMNYNSDFYYELTFQYNEAMSVLEIINNYENILLKIDYNMHQIDKVNNSLAMISKNSKNEYINFSNILIDKNLIYSFPYNIYLNNKNSNRTYGNNIPRNIYIDSNGNVYCVEIKNPKIIIGNLKNNNLKEILFKCKNKREYKKFIEYNEILLIEYLDQCPYQIIDYIAFLNEVIKNNE